MASRQRDPQSQVTDPWWVYAQGAAAALARGIEPPEVAVYGPILQDDEYGYLCTNAWTSRLVAGDGTYRHTSLMALGSAKFMVGMLAAQGIINHRRRKAARREAVPSWQLHQDGTVILTDRRLICTGSDGSLIDFWFGRVTEFYPDLRARSIVLAFGDDCAPLRIDGPAVPAIALWAAVGIYGDRWVNDARLHALVPANYHSDRPEATPPRPDPERWVQAQVQHQAALN